MAVYFPVTQGGTCRSLFCIFHIDSLLPSCWSSCPHLRGTDPHLQNAFVRSQRRCCQISLLVLLSQAPQAEESYWSDSCCQRGIFPFQWLGELLGGQRRAGRCSLPVGILFWSVSDIFAISCCCTLLCPSLSFRSSPPVFPFLILPH